MLGERTGDQLTALTDFNIIREYYVKRARLMLSSRRLACAVQNKWKSNCKRKSQQMIRRSDRHRDGGANSLHCLFVRMAAALFINITAK
jgi:hypothetical protein